MFRKLTKSPVCLVHLEGAKHKQKKQTNKKQHMNVSSIFLLLFFCCLSQLPCEPVCLSYLCQATRTCDATARKPPESSCLPTSEPKESPGRADTPFYLFRNKTVCTGVSCYLSTSFLPVLVSLPEEKMRLVSLTCFAANVLLFFGWYKSVRCKGLRLHLTSVFGESLRQKRVCKC